MQGVTVGERIVVHLSGFLRHHDAYEVPPEMTQDGIGSKPLDSGGYRAGGANAIDRQAKRLHRKIPDRPTVKPARDFPRRVDALASERLETA